jgi:hypothetical protein
MSHVTPDVPCTSAAVLELIRSRGHVSFVELERFVIGGTGTYDWVFFDGSLVLWHGLSRQLVEVLSALRVAKQVVLLRADPMVYFIDGGRMNLPVAHHFRAYTKPHWLPCTFSAFEHCSPREQALVAATDLDAVEMEDELP